MLDGYVIRPINQFANPTITYDVASVLEKNSLQTINETQCLHALILLHSEEIMRKIPSKRGGHKLARCHRNAQVSFFPTEKQPAFLLLFGTV